MSEATAALVADFADRASAAETTEKQLRQRLNDEIARAARERAFAYRRVRLVRALVAIDEADPVAAAAVQRRAVSHEIGWSGDSASEAVVLDALAPVAEAVWQCACGEASATSSADVMRRLEAFETWFERTHGKPFYALFDQYVTEVPVVDF